MTGESGGLLPRVSHVGPLKAELIKQAGKRAGKLFLCHSLSGTLTMAARQLNRRVGQLAGAGPKRKNPEARRI